MSGMQGPGLVPPFLEAGMGEEEAEQGSKRRWVIHAAGTRESWKSGMKTGDLSGLEAGVWEHPGSKLKGLEGVHEISEREKPGRRNPAWTGAEVCIHQLGGAAPREIRGRIGLHNRSKKGVFQGRPLPRF